MKIHPFISGAAAGFLLGFALVPAAASAAVVGPSPYLCFNSAATAGCGTADSPFKAKSYSYFHLETFEDGLLNVPGVNPGGGSVYGPASNADSVDADSGPVDGLGTSGRSWLMSLGSGFNFNATVLGQLPTDVGIVVTDGSSVTVQFLDSSLALLGSATFTGDGSFNGTTAEDRFIGWSGSTGVARLVIIDAGGGGLELDHLQYGVPRPTMPVLPAMPAIPEPATWGLMIAGFGLVGGVARRRQRPAVSLA